jgi:hypothetical protein
MCMRATTLLSLHTAERYTLSLARFIIRNEFDIKWIISNSEAIRSGRKLVALGPYLYL